MRQNNSSDGPLPECIMAVPEPQTEWSVCCPSCGEEFGIELIPLIVAGSWGPACEDKFQSCPECETLIEVASVKITKIPAESDKSA